MTVKFILEVRPQGDIDSQPLAVSDVFVPGPTISSDMQALWQKGTCSDVQFMVHGEVIKGHSQVLCARSEVFEKLLTVGLQDSVSKVITIEDCDPATFKAFLRFLYTDSLSSIEELCLKTSAATVKDQHGSTLVSQVQALLAVSHKYQVSRLQRWCEKTMSEQITLSEVCGVLCQAHLLQAQELEKSCLAYIKGNMAEVVKLPAYAELMQKWPQVMLKISLFAAGVSEAEAAAAIDALKGGELTGKRKRAEQE